MKNSQIELHDANTVILIRFSFSCSNVHNFRLTRVCSLIYCIFVISFSDFAFVAFSNQAKDRTYEIREKYQNSWKANNNNFMATAWKMEIICVTFRLKQKSIACAFFPPSFFILCSSLVHTDLTHLNDDNIFFHRISENHIPAIIINMAK